MSAESRQHFAAFISYLRRAFVFCKNVCFFFLQIIIDHARWPFTRDTPAFAFAFSFLFSLLFGQIQYRRYLTSIPHIVRTNDKRNIVVTKFEKDLTDCRLDVILAIISAVLYEYGKNGYFKYTTERSV